jgi:hypothetical protein
MFHKKSQEIIAGMKVWLHYGSAKNYRSREQAAFDSGILAASEFIRRYTDDEDLAFQVHGLLTPIHNE